MLVNVMGRTPLASISAIFSFFLLFAIIGFALSNYQYQPYNNNGGQSGNQYNSAQYGKFGNVESVQTYHEGRMPNNHRTHQHTQQQQHYDPQRLIQNSPKKLEMATFETEISCFERCEVGCFQIPFISERKDPVQKMAYYCAKLLPPKKALHEKLFKFAESAGPFEYTVGAILSFAILLCCLCSCYQCCCKRQSMRHHHRTRNFGSNELAVDGTDPNNIGAKTMMNGGGTHSSGLSPELESLTGADHGTNTNGANNIQHTDDGIHPAPLVGNGKGIGNGGVFSSIGNGAIQQQQHHQQPLITHNNGSNHRFPHSATGGFTMGSREQSIV